MIIAVSLVALNVSAQLVVKEPIKDSVVWQSSKLSVVPKLVKYSKEDVSVYTIFYQNAEYTTITDIDYLNIGDAVTAREFFELCNKVILEDQKYDIVLEGEPVYLSKMMNSVFIYKSDSKFFLSKKQVIEILTKI